MGEGFTAEGGGEFPKWPVKGGKTEPNADIRQMAQVAWQMYTALIDEGFDHSDAMGLVRDVLTAGLGG